MSIYMKKRVNMKYLEIHFFFNHGIRVYHWMLRQPMETLKGRSRKANLKATKRELIDNWSDYDIWLHYHNAAIQTTSTNYHHF